MPAPHVPRQLVEWRRRVEGGEEKREVRWWMRRRVVLGRGLVVGEGELVVDAFGFWFGFGFDGLGNEEGSVGLVVDGFRFGCDEGESECAGLEEDSDVLFGLAFGILLGFSFSCWFWIFLDLLGA